MIEAKSPPRHRVMGVDPGLAKVGWGIVDREGSRLHLVEYGVIHTKTAWSHAERLRKIFEDLQVVVDRHHPAVFAVEEVFQGKSPQSALKAGEGRGVCILAGALRDLRIAEYAASVIKLAVTGNGRAAKIQIQHMVGRLLGLDKLPRPHDAADALAVAITHLQRGR